MADDLSTSSDAPGAVDTSVDGNNASDDSAEDIDLEDIEVDESDMASEDDDQEAESDSEADDESEATDEASDDAESDEEAAESAMSDEDKQKQANNEAALKRIQERQARAAAIKADQAQYIADAAESADPMELAVRQLQVDGYNNTVEAVSNKLTNSYERALTDFPVLKTDDPVIQAEIDAAIDAFQATSLTIDSYGNATEVRGDLYATLKAKADSIEKLTGIKAERQEKGKAKEKSKTLTPPRRAPKQPKVDPDLAAFDEEANS
jgi:hypothetical protein